MGGPLSNIHLVLKRTPYLHLPNLKSAVGFTLSEEGCLGHLLCHALHSNFIADLSSMIISLAQSAFLENARES